ncbi:hypothetical protein CUC08_Gglean009797 [Alternaria sp. MG1]|nr:uncharacterized protein J4E82_008152 [Alternaria postmessia]RII06571.1 hypothetical protein CUC08_Gglean009797 [Alternaria sp. MG1]RYN38913.1 hypothetical protein AA0115_g67 [Alternaria tenuissima]RYN84720.1 hypothetical protein AA0117_g721 [Alternaria alternata]KAI5373162.1 hypothetical protein J4E82_008152 [Alternaria postmessia]RYN70025.1 hypothetical protein AA0118_g315 [Alternaria tenuissima]
MANQTPPPQRRWKQLYESLLLNIAEWQRESSYPSSLPLTETSHHPEPVTANSMENIKTGYAHGCLLEEGRGSAESKALLATGSQAKIYEKDVDEGVEDETIEQVGNDDGDIQDHPNLRMQWKWTLVSKRDTE